MKLQGDSLRGYWNWSSDSLLYFFVILDCNRYHLCKRIPGPAIVISRKTLLSMLSLVLNDVVGLKYCRWSYMMSLVVDVVVGLKCFRWSQIFWLVLNGVIGF